MSLIRQALERKMAASRRVWEIGHPGCGEIYSYQIADDTLRECTGISEKDEQGEELLDCIRRGSIDLTECRRTKRDRDEADYRQWLSEELKRINEENERFWRELGLPGGIKVELPASDERNEQ